MSSLAGSTPARLNLQISGDDHVALGAARGAALRQTLPDAFDAYARLFSVVGLTEIEVRAAGTRSLDTITDWRPGLAEEIAATASSAGLEAWQTAALNGRTELLATAQPAAARECSTLVSSVSGYRRGVQTWDWHVELADFWHTQVVAGPGHRYAGLTEQGILAKIGVNEAGLAVHLNILAHQGDHVRGVPIHVLCAAVLSTCEDIDEALELLLSAPVTSSSVLTLVEAGRAVMCELSPVGVHVLPEEAGRPLLHTNHFLHPVPAKVERGEMHQPDSGERLDLLRSRTAGRMPEDEAGLVALLASEPGEAQLTCRPDMSLPLGHRWSTLATIVTSPEERAVRVLDGMPTQASGGAWRHLHAGQEQPRHGMV